MSRAPKPAGVSARHVRRRRRTGRGALWIVALLLAGSGVLRLSSSAGLAIAQEIGARTGDSGEMATEVAICQTEADIALVLEVLRGREEAVAARESALTDRLQALSVAEAQIKTNMAALVEAEAALESTMALADTAAEDDLNRLTSVYENMKPKEAAPLFEAMDPQFAAGFLGRMRPDAAAAVMAGLAPETAYTISVILAGRNANVPSN